MPKRKAKTTLKIPIIVEPATIGHLVDPAHTNFPTTAYQNCESSSLAVSKRSRKNIKSVNNKQLYNSDTSLVIPNVNTPYEVHNLSNSYNNHPILGHINYLCNTNSWNSIHNATMHSEYRARAAANFRYKRLKRKNPDLTINPEIFLHNWLPKTNTTHVTDMNINRSEYRATVVARFRENRLKHKQLITEQSRFPNDTVLHPTPMNGTNIRMSSNRSGPSNHRAKKKKLISDGREYLTHIADSPAILKSMPDCVHCSAKKFHHETKNLCCSNGDVTLPRITIPPELEQMLLHTSTSGPGIFRVMIRAYNNHLAFTSLGLKYDKKLAKRNKGVYTFRIQGQVYHWINSLTPHDDRPKNLQFYYHDTDYELANRLACCPELDETILESLLRILSSNPYVRFFRSLSTIQNLEECQIVLRHNPVFNDKTYNSPSVSQVAIILAADENSGELSHRDIRVYKHSGEAKTIQYYYGCYDPLQYPLLYPDGSSGWHQGIPKNGVKKHKRRNCILTLNQAPAVQNITSVEQLISEEERAATHSGEAFAFVSLREYYSYKFQIRDDDKSHVLRFGRLFQQYCIDMYVKIETQRLDFFRAKSKQEQYRQEFLQGIVDAVGNGEHEPSKIGQRIILPSSFTGGPRYMRRKYIDAMTLVQKFGKPDIFLTMTCNANWPEIKQHLLPTETAQDRPDLTARIFHAKVEELKIELLKKQIFGQVCAYTYVIEYQKRGLPHVHFLLILAKPHKLHDPVDIDRIVSAEIPDKQLHPSLYKSVVKHMFHGPCGALKPDNVCMRKNKRCKDMYPKNFSNETLLSSGSYPTYRRRNNGKRVKVRNAWLDNRWVVPHPPYLVSIFDCHINVEICTSIQAVKYIYKYICKGSDKILFQLSAPSVESTIVDEIDNYVAGRWISPPEAMWRIFRFSMNEMKPPVISLPLHLENYQPITFPTNQSLSHILQNPNQLKTMLTEFFEMNKSNRTAIELKCTYADFPTHFVWIRDKKIWQTRTQTHSIGRIVTAQPSEGERFYLRMLLMNVPCPTSYKDLKTVDGRCVGTFHEAAVLRGLLHEDNSQQLCLEEASVFQLPYELRRLFASILVYSTPNDPSNLFHNFEPTMSEDFCSLHTMTPIEIRYKVLHHIDSFVQSMGKKLDDYISLPPYYTDTSFEDFSKEMRIESSIVVSENDIRLKYMLNSEQKEIFQIITSAIYSNEPRTFFVDGPGGTGKTFLYKALLAEVRSKGFYALANATSGIAASILPGGRTAHSRFKIPLDITDFTTCKVSKQSALAHLIRESSLIIWDEAPMAKRAAIESLNELLQDIMSTDQLFGGKVVVFGGDFRQILPVVEKGTKSQTLNACLVNSPLWPAIEKMHLTENMRARTDPCFTAFLMSIGEGRRNIEDIGNVRLPSECIIPNTDYEEYDLLTLIDFTYPNIDKISTALHTENKAILTTKNEFVDEINALIIEKFPGRPVTYTSFDETIDPNLQGQYQDILNSLSPNGLPSHKLILKENAPIILLRNLDPSEGLCNGTRLNCRVLKKNVIQAEISFGDFAGKTVFLHRIPLKPTTNECYPVPFKRIQFPVRLCFAMTINKAQGQTLDSVGIYLKEPVFSHGQLYVALSRAKSSLSVKVLMRKSVLSDDDAFTTKNIVYKEVLNT